ncbi:hypothetical protein PMG11_02715 [Penicillium brasilianum]|uniref:Uncharacterized protein n=1 Tax=Penicillium brasilianum TaxID=104259 RepID=A0A0F7TKW2_PENBI|nr:hypothetical protein PMG11_02715 [Penicillium brasilianum]
MAESLASNDVWASSVRTTWEKPVTEQKLPQVAVTPPSSSPKLTQSTPKASSYARAARPRKDQPPPATGPKHPVTPKPVTPIPVIPKLPGDAKAAAKFCTAASQSSS